MSAYQEYKTEFRDRDLLVEALCACGFTAGQIEVHEQAVPLRGYQGDKRSQCAHVVIPRRHVGGSSNDLGFERQADGSYVAHVSDYDRARYGSAWLGKLKQQYARAHVTRKAIKLGYKVQEQQTEQGNVQLVLTRWR